METRALGHAGIQVTTLGIGCNAFGTRIDQDATTAVVEAALDAGVTFFDTADVYGRGASEEMLGRALGSRRDEVVVATKFGMDMEDEWTDGRRGSAEYVRHAVDASLRRLGTDVIDLYQFHTPDRKTPIEETLGALAELVEAGKVRAIGCSNLQAWELVDADWIARSNDVPRFTTAQNEYSLYNRTAEVELAPACERLDVGILPYFPLAYGLLTGKYSRTAPPPAGSRLESQRQRFDEADWDTIEAIEAFARQHDATMLEVAIGGLAAQPRVASVIAGATKPEQVHANAAAVAWTPNAQQREELAAIGQPRHSYTTYAPR